MALPRILNVGTDIVHLPRIRALLSAGRHPVSQLSIARLNGFTRRILTDSEQTAFRKRFAGELRDAHESTSMMKSGITVSLRQISSAKIGVRANLQEEIATYSRQMDSNVRESFIMPPSPSLVSFLAGRFAAKEAARKAAPGGAAYLTWKDVTITVGVDGRPMIAYAPHILGEGGPLEGRLSLAHDGEYAIATVIAA